MLKKLTYSWLLGISLLLGACSSENTATKQTPSPIQQELKKVQPKVSLNIWIPDSDRYVLQNVALEHGIILKMDYKLKNLNVQIFEAPAPNQHQTPSNFAFSVIGGGEHQTVNINGQTWKYFEATDKDPAQLSTLLDGTHIMINSSDLIYDQFVQVAESMKCFNCR